VTSKSKNIDIDKTEDNHLVPDAMPEVILEEDPIVLELTAAVFATDFYKASGIAYCSLCGEKRRTNQSGLFCPANQQECPLL